MTRQEFVKRMNAIPPAVRKAVRQQMEANAVTLAAAIEGRAPKKPTGRLASSVRYETRSTDIRDVVFVKAGGPKTTKASRRGRPYDYARAVEFGTKRRPRRSPFFWPTVRLLRKTLRRRLNKAMREAVLKEF